MARFFAIRIPSTSKTPKTPPGNAIGGVLGCPGSAAPDRVRLLGCTGRRNEPGLSDQRGRSWPMAALARPRRTGSAYWGAPAADSLCQSPGPQGST